MSRNNQVLPGDGDKRSVDVPGFKRNVSFTFSGNVIFAACQWGILSVLTKLGTPDLVGRFALASAIATPFILFSNLQLRPVMASDARNDFSFGEYLALRLTLLPLALLLVIIVACVGFSGTQLKVIIIFATARTIESLSDIFYGYEQKHERMGLIAVSLGFKGVSSLVLFGATFAATRNLEWSLVAMALGWIVPLLFFDIPKCRRLMNEIEGRVSLKPIWRRPRILSLAWLALPLGVTMFLIQLQNMIPRLVLERQHGEAELGILSAMAYLIVAGNIVVLALSQSSIARLASARIDGRGFSRLVKRLLVTGFILGTGGVLVARFAGRVLLSHLYSSEYAAHQDVFVLVMVAGGLVYMGSLLGAPATAMQAYRAQMWIQGVTVVLMFGLARLLIPAYGMIGAAWVMIGGSAWVVAAYGVVVWRECSAIGNRP